MPSDNTQFLFEVGLDDNQLYTFETDTAGDVEAIPSAVLAFTVTDGHGLLFGAADMFLRTWDKIRSVGVVVVHPGTPEPVYKMMPVHVPSRRAINRLDVPPVRLELGLVDGNVRICDDVPITVLRGAIIALTTGRDITVVWPGAPLDFVWSAREIRFLRVIRKDVPAMIPDPADRLTEQLYNQLYDRYIENEGGVSFEPPLFNFDRRFANACDLAVQLLWAGRYGATPTDPHLHTSAPARQVAHLFAMAFGITGSDEEDED